MKKLKIIETGNRFGTMSDTKDSFGIQSLKIRKKIFLENRKKAAAHYGYEFDPYKFYIPVQQKDGSYQVLTEEMVKEEKDGWDLEIPADILMVTDKTPRVVAGYPVADCAVVIMSDLKNGITATAHCSAEFVDRHLPQLTLEALKQECDSKEDDIFVYISACAGNSWTYDSYPKWATDSNIWEKSGAIVEEHGIYRIDLRKAILTQIENRNFKNLIVNPADTITNNHYYSHSVASSGNEEKAGRHFAGVYYKK